MKNQELGLDQLDDLVGEPHLEAHLIADHPQREAATDAGVDHDRVARDLHALWAEPLGNLGRVGPSAEDNITRSVEDARNDDVLVGGLHRR